MFTENMCLYRILNDKLNCEFFIVNKKQIIFNVIITNTNANNSKGMKEKQCLGISQQSILKWSRYDFTLT